MGGVVLGSSSLEMIFTHYSDASKVLSPAEKDHVANQLQKNAEVLSKAHLERLLAGQPADVKAEILHINTVSRPKALQIALFVPLLAALLGLSSTASA